MTILLADDHAVLRAGLIQILSEAFPDAEFGEASTSADALALVASRHWDVVVLDLFMPGRGGLEVLHDIRREHESLPVLVLSSAPEEQLATRVIRAGASGYVNKQAAPEQLVQAIRVVMTGRRFVSGAVADRLVQEVGRTTSHPDETLSDREHDVLRRILAGQTVKDIADDLHLSPKTVSTYHTRLWEKLGVHNDVELVRYAVAHHLDDPPRPEPAGD
jgi:two-component system, NarL family, invasion response regulator UvrY